MTVYARIGNLSEGGLFLRTSTPLESGSRAVVRIGQEPVFEAAARVVWARGEGHDGPPGMGLEFEAVGAPLQDVIRRIIASEQERGGPHTG